MGVSAIIIVYLAPTLFNFGLFLSGAIAIAKSTNEMKQMQYHSHNDALEASEKTINIIENCLKPIMKELDVKTKPDILIKNCSGEFPYVMQKAYTKNLLVVPLGFFRLLSKKPSTARAILAHEIAHIKANDIDNYLFTSIYANNITKYILPGILISILLKLTVVSFFATQALNYLPVSYNDVLEEQFWMATAPVPVVIYYFTIAKLRRISEFNADMAAMIATDFKAIKSAIEMTYDMTSDSVFFLKLHPTKSQRIMKLEKLARRFLDAR